MEFQKFMKIKTYHELIQLPNFEERLDYLKLDGFVGETTFGFNRYLNQRFYHSTEWRAVCREIILRDNGCDLAIDARPIFDRIYVHHINPLSEEDLVKRTSFLLDPNFLICTSFQTHNLIHFGLNRPSSLPIERTPYDTCPWKQRR